MVKETAKASIITVLVNSKDNGKVVRKMVQAHSIGTTDVGK